MCLETKNGRKIKIVSWKQHKEDMNTLESSMTVSQSGAAH